MKVVFDTNILVSALVFPGGRGEAALVRILQEQDYLLLSKAILDLRAFRGVRVISLHDYLAGEQTRSQ